MLYNDILYFIHPWVPVFFRRLLRGRWYPVSCIILHYITLYYIILYYIHPWVAVSSSSSSWSSIPCVLYCKYIMLYYVILSNIILYYIILYYIIHVWVPVLLVVFFVVSCVLYYNYTMLYPIKSYCIILWYPSAGSCRLCCLLCGGRLYTTLFYHTTLS